MNILKANILALENSMNWLKRSLDICSKTTDSNDFSPEEMDAFEGLTSRFARTADILFNKLYRSIHYIKEGETSSWLDVLFYMEKSGLIGSVDDARLVKELRNDIVHEYALNDITDLFKEVLAQSPLLLKMAQSAVQEANKILEKYDGMM